MDSINVSKTLSHDSYVNFTIDLRGDSHDFGKPNLSIVSTEDVYLLWTKLIASIILVLDYLQIIRSYKNT
jgi:hypothetical protein